MDIQTLIQQCLEAAEKITNKPAEDTETQDIAFKLACATMAQEHSK